MTKRQRRVRPRYIVNVQMKAWDLAKAGAAVKLRVRDRGGLLATVEIGQGTFGWKSAHGRHFKRYSWRRLVEKLDQL